MEILPGKKVFGQVCIGGFPQRLTAPFKPAEFLQLLQVLQFPLQSLEFRFEFPFVEPARRSSLSAGSGRRIDLG